jgi:hypothetical protein
MSQKRCIWTFEVCKKFNLHMKKIYDKFQNIIPMLHGLLGLPSIGGVLLPNFPKYLVFLQASTMACNFQTK